MKRTKLFTGIMALVLLAASASAYDVWLGTHKWEGAAADNLDQWDRTIDKIEGINYVLLDARPNRPVGEGANSSDWNTMIAPIDQSIPGMAEIARSQYQPAHSRTLAERMVNEFATVENRGGEIDIMMLYDEGDASGTVYQFNRNDVQEVRNWLDNNGHGDVTLCFNLRNNDQERLALAQESIIDSVMIEASATRWVEDRYNVHTLLQDLWSDPSTSYKNIYFQIPRHETPNASARGGIPTSPINQYIETRRALWVIKDLMGDDFMQSDQCIFIVCNYNDTYPTYPETENNDTLYVNSKSGVALSLIEQRDIFEGRVGVVDEALCASYTRTATVDPGPTSGLVAHWPLDEGTGTNTANAAGTSFTASLENGATWGSDATRDSYVVFDGEDDRISTTFTYGLADTNDFTWAWWAKKSTAAGTDSGAIMVGNRYGGTGSETYEFIKFTPTSVQFANSDTTGEIESYNYDDVPQNEWHHYAMVKSGASYQWYVDGVAQGVASNFNYSESSAIPFLIGGDGDNKPNEHFEGCIDDVVLYRDALTPAEVADVQSGVYLPVIPMVDLGTPANLVDGSTWQDGLPAHSGSAYLVPNTGNLKSEDGSSTFPGYSLTVEGGGKFQFRAKQELGEITTVDNLITTGGTTGKSVNLAAGTGNNTDNHLAGMLKNDGFTKLSGYGNAAGPRNIRISSIISGSGTLYSTGTSAYPHTCTIANSNNTFSGVWESHVGTLAFETSGAVGAADISVLASGKLRIMDDWISSAILTVADTATANVDLGSNDWTVSSLVFGGTTIAEDMYTVSELNALGANAVFAGSGTIRVGTPLPPPVYELIAGWDTWDSGSAPVAAVLVSDVTGSAVTTSEDPTRPWHTTDERGASDDGTWGTHAGPPGADTSVADTDNQNLELPNAVTGGSITFTVSNNGSDDIELNAFHADLLAFRSKAARTYELTVLAGSDITAGVIYTSGAQEIYTPNGVPPDHDSHDDVDHSLLGLADHTLGADESVHFRLTFSGGAGDGSGGHDLWVDNVGITGALMVSSEPPVLEHSMSNSNMVFNWTSGGFMMQSRTNLTEGSWFDVPGGEVPPVTMILTNASAFYRLIEQ